MLYQKKKLSSYLEKEMQSGKRIRRKETSLTENSVVNDKENCKEFD